MARMVLFDLDAHAGWAFAGTVTMFIACGLRVHTSKSKYVIWPVALYTGSIIAHSMQLVFPAHVWKCVAVTSMIIVSIFDLSVIPAAVLSCITAANPEKSKGRLEVDCSDMALDAKVKLEK